MASMGAVGFPGKSRFSASVTMRGAALEGNAVASTPPQHDVQERRAEAEQQHHDRHRVEQWAAHDAVREPVPAAAGLGAGGRRTERRIRSEFTFGPSTASNAGSTVSAAIMSTSTVATPP